MKLQPSRLSLSLVFCAFVGCANSPATVDWPKHLSNSPQYLMVDERAEYLKQFWLGCIDAQRKDSFGRYLTGQQQSEYCACTASRSAETVTLKELGAYLKTKNEEEIRPHMSEVTTYCIKKLAPQWLPEVFQKTPASQGGVTNGYSDAELTELLRRKNSR